MYKVIKVSTARLIMLLCAVLCSTRHGVAIEAYSPIATIPGSNSNQGGPTVWDFNQEVSALAEDRSPDPALQAKGIPLGAFRLFPAASFSIGYDDNVFRVPAAKKSDLLFIENPGLTIDYQREGGEFRLFADGAFSQYTRWHTADDAKFDTGLTGDYFLMRDLWATGNISFSRKSDPLSSPNVVLLQDGPTPFTLFDASGQLVYQPNRLALSFGASTDTYTYSDTPLAGGGRVTNEDRNRTIRKAFAQVTYHFSPGYAAFVRSTFNTDDYQLSLDRSGIHRSSNGVQLDGGVNLLLGHLVSGEIFAGYVRQQYDQNQLIELRDISGPEFGASLKWYATELLTLHLEASREIEDTIVAGAAGGDDRNVGLRLDYELSRRINLFAGASYDDTNYRGSMPRQLDTLVTVNTGARYAITRNWNVTATYEHAQKHSTLSSYNYSDNLVTLGVALQL